MRKRFFIVDCITNEIVATVKIGAGEQVVYDDPPELRKGTRLSMIGFDCFGMMLVLVFAGYFVRSLFHALMPLASVAAAFGLILSYLGWWLERSAKKSGEGNQNKKRHLYNGYTPSVGPWKDPYGLAQDNTDTPGKKAYYIVDSQTNAIVDVKRLGKWGQAYVKWRSKRQKRNHKEGGA